MKPSPIKSPKEMSRKELIEEINVLGPWVHGAFDLGNDLVIEDRDKLHKKRIEKCRDYFLDIVENHYGKVRLEDKSICDVGCNTGYFLFELQKQFGFKYALGLEPRESNLAKASFIARYFELPVSQYELKTFDILTSREDLPQADIVMMPGVLHHLSDHLQALRNLYRMTRELCIVETCVLPDETNTEEVAKGMFLGESLYRGGRNRDLFGIVGYKLETNQLDGATFQSGIVGVTTARVLAMMMEHVGFSEVKIYRDDTQLRHEVFSEKTYRQYNSAIVVGSKEKNVRNRQQQLIEEADAGVESEKFKTFVPLGVIAPLYRIISGQEKLESAEQQTRLVYESTMHPSTPDGEKASAQLLKEIGTESYFSILCTFKHAPSDKITFEYAKTAYHLGKIEEAETVASLLTETMNLDWRTVYMTYFLLAKIKFDRGEFAAANRFNDLSLRAHPVFSLAIELRKTLGE